MIATVTEPDFDAFVRQVEPRLRRALAGHLRLEDVPDAVAEALGYAWEHWDELAAYANPAGYLYRVARSRARRRRRPARLLPPDPVRLPHVEPALVPALSALPPQQRAAVWLVHGCDWSYL